MSPKLAARTRPQWRHNPRHDLEHILWLPEGMPGVTASSDSQKWYDQGRRTVDVTNDPTNIGYTVGTRDTMGVAGSFDGGRIRYASQALLTPGQSDFTLEIGVAYNSTGIGGRTYACGKATTNGTASEYYITKNVSNSIYGAIVVNSITTVNTPVGPTAVANKRYDIVMSRIGGTRLRLWVNGVDYGSTTLLAADDVIASSGQFAIGGLGDYLVGQSGTTHGGTFGVSHPGWIYYCRFTRGVALYDSKPPQPFQINQFRGLHQRRCR
jgi:hypothetical protein